MQQGNFGLKLSKVKEPTKFKPGHHGIKPKFGLTFFHRPLRYSGEE